MGLPDIVLPNLSIVFFIVFTVLRYQEYKNKVNRRESKSLFNSLFYKSACYLGLGFLLGLRYFSPEEMFKSTFEFAAGKYVAVMAGVEGIDLMFKFFENEEAGAQFFWFLVLFLLFLFIIWSFLLLFWLLSHS